MVKPRAVVIDVGINRITDGEGNSRLVGMSTLNLFKVWRNFSPGGGWRHDRRHAVTKYSIELFPTPDVPKTRKIVTDMTCSRTSRDGCNG